MHSTLYTLHHSTLYTLHSTLHHALHFTHSTLHTPHSSLLTPHFTLHTPHFTLYTPHSTLYTLHSTLYTLHFTHFYTMACFYGKKTRPYPWSYEPLRKTTWDHVPHSRKSACKFHRVKLGAGDLNPHRDQQETGNKAMIIKDHTHHVLFGLDMAWWMLDTWW